MTAEIEDQGLVDVPAARRQPGAVRRAFEWFTRISAVPLFTSLTRRIVVLNLAALIVFAAGGHILWALGLTMGVANLAGGVIGARTAVRKGSGFVRVVFLVVVATLLLKLGYDVVRGG